ncbi:MAG TPA: hypothetical protein VFT59_05490 [Candidatus Saccharimonadales bacterium]|nr:hypothetical protein [Candidatus Saccharimonadales bacterium]
MDPVNARRIRHLIWERIQQEPRGWGIDHGYLENEEFYEFCIGQQVFTSVLIWIDRTGQLTKCMLHLIDGLDMPAAYIFIDGDAIRYSGRPENQYQRVLKTIEHRLISGYMIPKVNTPYGYIQDDIVTAIFFSRLRNDGGVEGAWTITSSAYTLEGYELPTELFTTNVQTTSEYLDRIGGLLETGRIVELRQRVTDHPGKLWLVTSDVAWPHLVFDQADERQPLLPVNKPYFLRLASDGENDDLPRTRDLVVRYQEASLPPEDMSEFFT